MAEKIKQNEKKRKNSEKKGKKGNKWKIYT